MWHLLREAFFGEYKETVPTLPAGNVSDWVQAVVDGAKHALSVRTWVPGHFTDEQACEIQSCAFARLGEIDTTLGLCYTAHNPER